MFEFTKLHSAGEYNIILKFDGHLRRALIARLKFVDLRNCKIRDAAEY